MRFFASRSDKGQSAQIIIIQRTTPIRMIQSNGIGVKW